MFAEELTKIRECESKADELQKKARADARQAVAEAKAKAEQILSDAGISAKETLDSLIREGQTISDGHYDQYLTAVRQECSVMIENARKNQADAVNLIAERIVRASVNN